MLVNLDPAFHRREKKRRSLKVSYLLQIRAKFKSSLAETGRQADGSSERNGESSELVPAVTSGPGGPRPPTVPACPSPTTPTSLSRSPPSSSSSRRAPGDVSPTPSSICPPHAGSSTKSHCPAKKNHHTPPATPSLARNVQACVVFVIEPGPVEKYSV
jgi:hypothetical protein